MLQRDEEVLNQVYQVITVPIIKKDTLGHKRLSGCEVKCYVIDHQPTSRKMLIQVDIKNRSGLMYYHDNFFLDMDLRTGFKVAKLEELDVNEVTNTVTYRLAQEPSLEMGAEFRSLVPRSVNKLVEYIDVTIMDLDKDIFMDLPTDIRYMENDSLYLLDASDFNNYIDLRERTIPRLVFIISVSIEYIVMAMMVTAIRIRTFLSRLIASMSISHQLEL